jgi:exopolyphosphatase/guanosine-5'-triphosphate,3'-diphosphate pyrophosphatase
LGALTPPGPYLVAYIGGGSTELAAGPAPDATAASAPRAAAVRSLDVGCVRLSERYLHHDPPQPDELDAARAEARRHFAVAFAEQPALAQATTLIGLAGTVAALAGIEQGLEVYRRDRVHHYLLRRASVERLLAELAAIPAAQRRRRAGVEEARADVIVGGAVVLAELMATAGHDECLTSESDILDGLAETLRN